MYCNRCGTHNPDDAQFCSKCGSALAAAGAAVTPAPKPTPHSPPAHTATPPAAIRPAGDGSSGFPPPTIKSGPILDRASARAHIMAGFVAAILGVILSLIVAATVGSVMVGSAVIYAVIAFGLWRSSRIAAVAGLLLSISNIVGMITVTKGAPTQWISFGLILLIVAYWSALRGANAEHRLRGQGRTAAA
ncbi:MAG: zinc ribbon domain-containing protein [Acidobacteriota bacterium]|nr:zinc ribbon domain-containing protein [Acidobacteriota bacterium]